MRIEEEFRDNVAILRVSGPLMSGPDVAPFHDRIKGLIEEGIANLVVDFSKVKWFGSAMLGVLIASLTTVRNAGGDLRLTGITEKIDSILMVTQLAGVLRNLDTLDRAVASYKTQPPEAGPR